MNRGVDLHLNTLRILYPEKVRPDWKRVDDAPQDSRDDLSTLRKDVAKPVNFGISYGLGVQSLTQSLSEPKDYARKISSSGATDEIAPPKTYSSDEVETFLERFHSEYPEIRTFQASVEQDLLRDRVSTNLFGRQCRVGVLGHLGMTRIIIEVKGCWYETEVICHGLDAKSVTVAVNLRNPA